MNQLVLFETGETWIETSDSDPRGLFLFKRHYSYRHKRNYARGQRRQFVGPGERLVLISPAGDALFVWRKERFRRDGETGINCAIFRNEGPRLSSELIRKASKLAHARWPKTRLFTFIDPRKVASVNPGYCFIKAGWQRCGITKTRKLLIFELEVRE